MFWNELDFYSDSELHHTGEEITSSSFGISSGPLGQKAGKFLHINKLKKKTPTLRFPGFSLILLSGFL
jgi:hypothetical protein